MIPNQKPLEWNSGNRNSSVKVLEIGQAVSHVGLYLGEEERVLVGFQMVFLKLHLHPLLGHQKPVQLSSRRLQELTVTSIVNGDVCRKVYNLMNNLYFP
ncbi:hypothetical protein Tco_0668573 [Tanacetum coccineum]